MRFLAAFAALLSVTAAIPLNTFANRQAPNTLNLQFDNTLSTDLYWYISGTETTTGKTVFVNPDGSLLHAANEPAGPIANIDNKLAAGQSNLAVTIPTYINGGRIYFSEGPLVFTNDGSGTVAEPSVSNTADTAHGLDWGFVEFTLDATAGTYINISYVDWVGLPIGLSMNLPDGSSQAVAGLNSDAVDNICAKLSTFGAPWSELCVQDGNGNNLRVLSPNDYITLNPSAFSGYWTAYVDAVWNTYTASNPLTIATQTNGAVTCHSSGTQLLCADASGQAAEPFDKPSDIDIFSCNDGAFSKAGKGPLWLTLVSPLCAGFIRGVLLSENGDDAAQQPVPEQYFFGQDGDSGLNTWDRYSEVVHSFEPDHKGYTFAFDDLTAPGDADSSGALQAVTAGTLALIVGGN